jgi:putative spermidine/putrescine transport system substrate-binding protein
MSAPAPLSARLFALLGATALIAAACAPAATPTAALEEPTSAPVGDFDWSTATSAAAGGGMEALVAAAQAEGALHTIALPRDWCNYGEMLDTFSAKYGIALNELDPNAGSADELEAIRANQESGGPQAPDVVDVGVAFGPQAKEEGLITPYKVETWDTIQDVTGAKDADGYFYPDYGGVLTIQVNTDIISDVPADWADLLDPKYNGQIALAGDPRASNQAAQTVYAAALASGGTLDDITPGLEYFRQMNEVGNLLPLIAGSGTYASGETPITFSWNYLGLAAAEAEGAPATEIVYPASGTWGGWYLQGVSTYAPNPAAARLWQEFLYSNEGQMIWMKGYCVPARLADMRARGVVPDDLLARMPAEGIMENAQIPSVEQLSAARERIAAEWDSVVGLDIVEQ